MPDSASVSKSLSKFKAGKYIVTLKDAPASTYTGGLSGYAATKPSAGKQLNARATEVKKYTSLLEGRQKTLAAKVGAKTLYNYTVAYNGFAAELTSDEAARLAASPSVKAVTPNELLHTQAATGAQTSGEYLKITTPSGVWDSIGGPQNAGKGVVVGVLDTGIAPENPSFAGDPLGTAPSTNKPYLSGNNVIFAKSDGNTYSTTRVEGEQFTNADYSTKIVGAKYFVEGFGEDFIGNAADNGEYLSPRDGDSHGSHTGSTAVGNNGVTATVSGKDFGEISGVAPAAKIAAYKVCWSGQAPDPDETADDGCTTLDLVAAIDSAVSDGVDVINYSIGGSSAQTVYSPTDEAFLNAAAAGVFVSASAGNSGPGASTLDNAAPWETTVAASTIPSYEATLVLGNSKKYVGASISVDRTAGATPLTGDLVLAENFPASGSVTTAKANHCTKDSLSAAVAGKIVICERGDNGRLAKSVEVKRAGGIGMVLLNVDPGDTITDDHVVPTIHIDAPYNAAVRAYAATANPTATFLPNNTTGKATPVPQVAGFSSRGPVEAAGSDVLKPDVTAPGVSILAAGANAEGEAPTYEFLSGTSMSAPHVTGLAALYLGQHPQATPAEVKSALSTTATDTVDNDNVKTTDPFTQGAGEVNPSRFLNPGLLYLSGLNDWKRYLVGTGEAEFAGVTAIDPSNLNLPSIAIGDLVSKQTITRTVTSVGSGTWTPTISVPGVATKVTPSSLRFTSSGQSQSFTVSFERKSASLDTWKTGFLTWKKTGSTTSTVRIPLAVHPTSVKAPEVASGTGTSGSTAISVTPGATGSFAVDAQGLAQGVVTENPDDPTTPYTAVAASGGEAFWPHTVAEGTSFARFEIAPVTPSIQTDLDLYVLYSPVASDDPADYEEVASSATASGSESVELVDPEPGYYLTHVDYFSAPAGGAPYTDIAYLLNDDTNVGNLTATPATVKGTAGVTTPVNIRWGGLDPNSFFIGFIYYGDAEDSTRLEVVTGDTLAPVSVSKPTITGKPAPGETLTANTGTWDADSSTLNFQYQWLEDGEAISGETNNTLLVTDAMVGHKIGLIVTARVGDGPSKVVAASPISVKAPSTTTFTLSKNPIKASEYETVTVTVASALVPNPTGVVTVKYGAYTKTATLTAAKHGTVSIKLPKLNGGKTYTVKASYAGDSSVSASASSSVKLVVKK